MNSLRRARESPAAVVIMAENQWYVLMPPQSNFQARSVEWRGKRSFVRVQAHCDDTGKAGVAARKRARSERREQPRRQLMPYTARSL